MAELTIQDVANYLAEHGYATWNELNTRKMLTESGMWTRLQSNYDSTHAIDSRYITFPTVDLSAYATEAAMKAWVQSQNYITQSPDLSQYVTNSALNAMGLASQSWVSQNYATQAALNNYLPLSGGTLTGALTLANNTWNSVGDDCYIGDHNIAGGFGILGRNGNTRLDFCQYEHSEIYQSIVFDGTNLGVQRWKIGECVITYDNGMLHFSTGIYSDGAVTAGGVGTSGGSGGGGLSWANLAASTTEQIALSHLTTALSGYVSLSSAQVISGAKDFTSRIKVSDVGDLYVGGVFYDSYDWVGLWSQHDILVQSESDVQIDGEHVNIDSVSGTYVSGTFDVGGAVSLLSTLTVSGQVTAKKFVATDYNSSDYLLTGDGGAISKSTLLSGYATTSQLHSHSNKSTLDGITSTKVSNWDTAYGWGNHASAGYLTSLGYRPIIGMSGTTTEWLDSNTGVILPLTSLGGGNYKLDYDTICSGYVKTSALSSIFTELDVSGTTLYVTVGGTRKSTTLPGGMSATTSRRYTSSAAFRQVFTHVTDFYGVVEQVVVLATSGNDYLLAITMYDTEGQTFTIRAISGNKILWQSPYMDAYERTMALVWMNINSYYTIDI